MSRTINIIITAASQAPITVMFTEPFMQRALLAALFLAPLCAFLGVFVTARRMAFFSDTVSHAALAGVALGFWLGFLNPTLPLVLVSGLIAVAVYWLKESTELLTDTIMALLLSGSVAVGIILLSMLKGYQGEIQRYLFGDILAIGPEEVWTAAGLFLLVGAGLFYFLNDLSLITVQEELAHVCGIRVRALNYAFVIVLTLTVTVTIRLLGIILVTSLLVIPAAAARTVSRNLRQQIILSILFGGGGGVIGIALSYQLNVPCGPMIVLTCIALFIVCVALSKRARPKAVIPA
jgi:zinc transport system permease protein